MSETLYEDIRLNISWDDPTITGQEFVDQTRGFVSLLAKQLPQFPRREIALPQERRMAVLEPDFSNFDALIRAGQKEGEETVRLDRHAYLDYIARLLFYSAKGDWAFKLRLTLSAQRGSNTVSFDFAPAYQNEELVIPLFMLTLKYWRPQTGCAGSWLALKEHSTIPNKRLTTGVIFDKDPAFAKDLPDFVKVTHIANGYVLQVLDHAPFADSPQGREKMKMLFEILAQRGLLDLPEQPKVPTPPPPTPEEFSERGIGGASAPIKPRRFPKRT